MDTYGVEMKIHALAAIIGILSLSNIAHAAECFVAGQNNAVIYEGHDQVKKKVQFLAEKNAKGDKFLFGFAEASSLIGVYSETIVIKYKVSLMRVYAENDKEPAGSRDVLVVLNKSNCALIGRPLDLGANRE